jgi:hypothetical protein
VGHLVVVVHQAESPVAVFIKSGHHSPSRAASELTLEFPSPFSPTVPTAWGSAALEHRRAPPPGGRLSALASSRPITRGVAFASRGRATLFCLTAGGVGKMGGVFASCVGGLF